MIEDQESQLNNLKNKLEKLEDDNETLKNKLIFMQNNHEVEISEL